MSHKALEITQEEIEKNYDYCPSGRLLWRIHEDKSKIGQVASYEGSEKRPYRQLPIRRGDIWRSTGEHRAIWTFFNGTIPDGLQIDHINMIKDDNRLFNLRFGDFHSQQLNTRTKTKSASGYRGVTFRKRQKSKPWELIYNTKYVGRYADKEEAARAYDALIRAEFGPNVESTRFNFPDEA